MELTSGRRGRRWAACSGVEAALGRVGEAGGRRGGGVGAVASLAVWGRRGLVGALV